MAIFAPLQQAALWFNETLRVQPDHAQAHRALAELLLMQGKRQQALRHYEEAQRLTRIPHVNQ
jgi:tetratricopeptide (TPR) repeat protein